MVRVTSIVRYLLIMLLVGGCTATTSERTEPLPVSPVTGGDPAAFAGTGATAGNNTPTVTGGSPGTGGSPDTGGSPRTASTGGSPAGGGPAPRLLAEDIWRQLRRVNDHWILAHEDPGGNTWDRATYFSANMVAYETLKEAQYLEYSKRWAAAHGWGLNDGVGTRNADNHCAGQTYLALYQLDPSPEKTAAIQASISAMVSSSRRDDWWWIDALHMAMPVFAALANLTNDDRYRQAMYEFYADTRNRRGLYNDADGLWYRDDSFKPPNRTPSGADVYWSRGNGWVFAALAKTLNMLPDNDPHRAEYIRVFQEMAEALKAVQQADGFFYTSLHDPNQLGGPESSGTGFFTYGMAWGINNGLLDRDEFEPIVVRAWEALNETAVHPDGRLGYCQRIDVGPGPSRYDDYTDYGVGAYILAGCELFELFKGPLPNQVAASVTSFSSEEAGNEAGNAVDGDVLTRWSANGYPQTIELDLGANTPVEAIEVHGYQNRAYRYSVEGMVEGGGFELLVDRTNNSQGGKIVDRFATTSTRYLRITITGASSYDGGWTSISDIRVLGTPES